jgi:hypothetical protein
VPCGILHIPQRYASIKGHGDERGSQGVRMHREIINASGFRYPRDDPLRLPAVYSGTT